ncbi:conserved exported hypothetical protein [Paraburkholderia unamae]|uniref:hypothetical protein n=1 Tax=Paraburkholderia unamae TaxID=219649 RepID=UPI000DC4A4E4|nr:hypothetical protein [Paraburkholderia unamae]RAR63943.1 hypothetical protein C7401_105207 [Paraburkholderia unamae]CAG9245875.1 conserved exported hypothetical protein [Paraburkholderia unamae]
MTARKLTHGASRRLVQAAAALCGVLAAGVTTGVAAQQVTNPGDIIVERDITPRSAFANVPKNQDPVLVRATTFPKNSFDPAMAALVTDTDLVNAHGSSGVNTNGAMSAQAAGVQAITRILAGNATGSNTAAGPGASAGVGGGLGSTISSTITGALAPLTGAMGGMK